MEQRILKATAEDAGARLDAWLAGQMEGVSRSAAARLLEEGQVTCGGRPAAKNTRLQGDETVCVTLPDPEAVDVVPQNIPLDIVYEDENLMLLNKRPGLLCHADEHEKVNTLITHIQAYLYQKKEWNPRDEHSFTPALCNRIDRNTGGIVMAAKNAETLRILNQKIRDREIAKFYLAIVHGRMKPSQGKLEGFLLKDENRAQVKVFSRPVPGGKSAATLYKTLRTAGGLSLVECELLTGRTHQIRAQFAAAGHPLLGDGKYGRERDNKKYGRSFQALYSYKLAFTFPTDAGLLEYLRGRVFTVEQVDFVAEYFPTGERV